MMKLRYFPIYYFPEVCLSLRKIKSYCREFLLELCLSFILRWCFLPFETKIILIFQGYGNKKGVHKILRVNTKKMFLFIYFKQQP